MKTKTIYDQIEELQQLMGQLTAAAMTSPNTTYSGAVRIAEGQAVALIERLEKIEDEKKEASRALIDWKARRKLYHVQSPHHIELDRANVTLAELVANWNFWQMQKAEKEASYLVQHTDAEIMKKKASTTVLDWEEVKRLAEEIKNTDE